jgi:hypothetical protein
MVSTIQHWMIVVLTAKVFADLLRQQFAFGQVSPPAGNRSEVQIDRAYVVILLISSWVVNVVGVSAALPLAMLVRVGILASDRILIAANHVVLELLLLVVMYALLDAPTAMASAVQIVAASVWFYSAFQKLYHGEFWDGSFFYQIFQGVGTGPRVLRDVPTIPTLSGFCAPVDPRAAAFCRRLAMLVVVSEFGAAVAALLLTGSPWATLLLAAVSIEVGLISKETNFMVTNVAVSTFFLVPLSGADLMRMTDAPTAIAVLAWCLVWPPLHAVATRRARISPWKLAGWGMYATGLPRLGVLEPDGSLRVTRSMNVGYYALLTQVYGACSVTWLRNYARRRFFSFCHPQPADALVLLWYRRRGNAFITVGAVVPNADDSTPALLETREEPDWSAFTRRSTAAGQDERSLAAAPGAAGGGKALSEIA